MRTPAVSVPGESLPDFSGVDLAALYDRSERPALSVVLEGLLARPRTEHDTFAAFEDTP
ncbi:hypothetical protein [Streptomyces purpureus]|uniref:FXSXX-COOH protein n=1 Tax=Streptomyces purpureus TaxID=1951 RepID=A0A918H2T4_9ACTN|nr:hypothetical protein [Streptomyces purpureus]GGT32976.1 hypothetical protein GCM10014713_28100 [Streptomyces purpureus]